MYTREQRSEEEIVAGRNDHHVVEGSVQLLEHPMPAHPKQQRVLHAVRMREKSRSPDAHPAQPVPKITSRFFFGNVVVFAAFPEDSVEA